MQSARSPEKPPADKRRWVVMGVAGCGKSTLGRLLAGQLGLPFVEGDEEHPPSNIAKMRAGTPLTDADRLPWLLLLQSRIADAERGRYGLVLACSALKVRYRKLLRGADPQLTFLHLHGSPALLAQRLGERSGHFMPATLLESQLRDLEPLTAEENGMRLDASRTPEQLMEQIFHALRENI